MSLIELGLQIFFLLFLNHLMGAVKQYDMLKVALSNVYGLCILSGNFTQHIYAKNVKI